MAAWVKEEENASEHWQRKRDAEEADKVEVAPGVPVASLRCLRAALIGPVQGLPKRRRLCSQEKPETLKVRSLLQMLCLWGQMRDSCDPEGVSSGSQLAVHRSLSIECPSIFFWNVTALCYCSFPLFLLFLFFVFMLSLELCMFNSAPHTWALGPQKYILGTKY